MYTVNVGSDFDQDTSVLNLTCNDTNTIKSVYEELANDPALPEMGIVTVSDENYTGLYWDRKLNEDVLYTPYGRSFNTEELDSGAAVALLGTDYLKNVTQENLNSIWETGIDINGKHFNAVGNYFFVFANEPEPEDFIESLRVQTAVTIPLKTYFNIGLVPVRFRCVFSQPLTSAQIMHLNDVLQPFGNIQSLSLPKTYQVDAVNSYIKGITPFIAVLILSLLSIVSIILYWLRKEFARYRVYLICGARGRQIAYFISLNVALLVTITYACAYLATYGITKISPEGFISPLPWLFYIFIYIGVMIFTLSAVNIRAIPIVFREKMLQK